MERDDIDIWDRPDLRQAVETLDPDYRASYRTFLRERGPYDGTPARGPEWLRREVEPVWTAMAPWDLPPGPSADRIISAGHLLYHAQAHLAGVLDGMGSLPRVELENRFVSFNVLPAVRAITEDPKRAVQAVMEFQVLRMHQAAEGNVGLGIFMFLFWKYHTHTFQGYAAIARILLREFTTSFRSDREVIAAFMAGAHKAAAPTIVVRCAEEMHGAMSSRIRTGRASSGVAPGGARRELPSMVAVDIDACDPRDPHVLDLVVSVIDPNGELWGERSDRQEPKRIFVSNLSHLFVMYLIGAHLVEGKDTPRELMRALTRRDVPEPILKLGFEPAVLARLTRDSGPFWLPFTYLHQRLGREAFLRRVLLAGLIFQLAQSRARESGSDLAEFGAMPRVASSIRPAIEQLPVWREVMSESRTAGGDAAIVS